jgi:hypothetical protein
LSEYRGSFRPFAGSEIISGRGNHSLEIPRLRDDNFAGNKP